MKINIAKSYTEIIDSKRGCVPEPGFVVGAGSSLSSIDLSEVFEYSIFSVNSSIILMPWESGPADRRYWVSNDALCMGWSYWSKLTSCNCNKIVRTSWLKHFNKVDDFYFFHPRNTSEGIIDSNDDALAYCSSVPTALDIAIKMNLNPIFLLGVDQNFPKSSNGSHFWHNLPTNDQPRRSAGGTPPRSAQSKTFLYNNMAYKALSKFARSKGIEIYNCNERSSVEEFKKIDFGDFRKYS